MNGKSRFGLLPRHLSYVGAYDYAYQTSEYWHFNAAAAEDITAYVGGLPVSDISGHKTPSDDGLCRRVAETAFARWELSEYEAPNIKQLALLTNVTKSATRPRLAVRACQRQVGRTIMRRPGCLDGAGSFRPKMPYLSEGPDTLLVRIRLLAIRVGDGAEPADHGVDGWGFITARMAGRPILVLDAQQRVGTVLEMNVPQFVGLALQEGLRARENAAYGP